MFLYCYKLDSLRYWHTVSSFSSSLDNLKITQTLLMFCFHTWWDADKLMIPKVPKIVEGGTDTSIINIVNIFFFLARQVEMFAQFTDK